MLPPSAVGAIFKVAEPAAAAHIEFHRCLDDPPQDNFYVEVCRDSDDGLEQRVYPVPDGKDRLQPDLELRQ